MPPWGNWFRADGAKTLGLNSSGAKTWPMAASGAAKSASAIATRFADFIFGFPSQVETSIPPG